MFATGSHQCPHNPGESPGLRPCGFFARHEIIAPSRATGGGKCGDHDSVDGGNRRWQGSDCTSNSPVDFSEHRIFPPDDLAELLRVACGHVRGGIVRCAKGCLHRGAPKPGRFGRSRPRGTLFLDEIAEIPLALQAKLLQFLETREYRRLGSVTSLHFNGRIIAATNKLLETEVQQERFRADLWYRLDVFNIHIPPLRDRKEDLSTLIEVLLESISRKYQRQKPFPRPEDIAALQAHGFPGNVRELRNIVERSLLQTPPQSHWLEMDPVWTRKAYGAPVAASVPDYPRVQVRSLTPIEEQEYQLINRTLNEERGFIRRAAAKLGMSHQALLRRLQKWPELRVAALER